MTMTMLMQVPEFGFGRVQQEEPQTQVNLRALPDLLVRSEIRNRNLVAESWPTVWQSTFEGSLQWIEIVPSLTSERTVVDLVEYLKSKLHIPMRTLLRGASIKRRTYYSWVNDPSIDPRVSSAGRLWDLASCVADLEGILPDVKGWFADEGRRDLLSSGAFDELFDLAIGMTYVGRRQGPSDYYADDSFEPEWTNAMTKPDSAILRKATRVD